MCSVCRIHVCCLDAMFIAGTPQLYLVFSLAEQMQELEQRLLDAEQRAENA